jgi:phage antirepressor YoqD-like protein
LPLSVDARTIDVGRYTDLMVRAAAAVLQPLGVKEKELYSWLMGYGYQIRFQFNATGAGWGRK